MSGAAATTPAATAAYGYDDASLICDAPVDAGLGRTIERASTVASAVELDSADRSAAGSLGHGYDPTDLVAPSGTAQVLTNQCIGNAAADSIAARFPGSAREVSLQAASGRRVVDVLTDTGLAIESNVGRTSLTTMTRRQIGRYVELMTNLSSPVASVRWEFFTSPVAGRGGPTGPLAQALNDAGIPFVVHP